MLDGVEVHVGEPREFLGERRELEVVRGEQGVARVLAGRWRAMAQASARPSKVVVPRPISSISTRLSSVALCRMLAVSVISTMKVERPPARSSPAPMRVKIRSIGPSTALLAGTKLPMCASSAISATWRM